MKVPASFKVDVDVLKNFLDVLKENNEFPDDVIESFMKEYSEEITAPEPIGGEGVYLTEELLQKCEDYKVGKFADIVLRKLLESGVASEEEIAEMQKASGKVQIQNYNTTHGFYNNKNFKTAFPVLITEQQKRDYDQNLPKFRVIPLNIGGRSFHLSAQWFPYNRKPMENWIRSHLPKWFEHADEEQKTDMKNFISNDI